MSRCLILFTIVLLVGCAGKDDKSKQSSGSNGHSASDEVEKKKERKVEVDTAQIDLSTLSDTAGLPSFVEAYKAQFDVASFTPSGVLSRFKGTEKLEYGLTTKFDLLREDSSVFKPGFVLKYFEFGDTTRMQNAMLNLMACFGKSCEEIEWMKDTSGLLSTPAFYLINETSVIVMNHPCEPFDWESIQRDLVSVFGRNNSVILQLNCNGILRWNH